MARFQTFGIAVVAIVAITASGMIWEATAFNVFARQAGGLSGMIANPNPIDDLNYNFTPRGRHYELWAARIPVFSTCTLLLVAGTIGASVLVSNGLRRRALALSGVIVLCAVLLLAVTLYYLAIATNFFI